jgi:hypothetical protein
MNMKSLRYLLAVGLMTMAGYSWATPSLPLNDSTKWQNIASIEWSTDVGANWGTSSTVSVGQSVEFKVTMNKTDIGNHYADFVKVWIDMNGDGTFEQSEAVLFNYQVANSTYQNSGNTERPYTGQPFSFVSNAIKVTSTMPSDLWVLARVTCSESLLTVANGSGYSWNQQWVEDPATTYTSDIFSPTAQYKQGQSELVMLTVPEPGTLALVTLAILGMGWRRKQTTRV